MTCAAASLPLPQPDPITQLPIVILLLKTSCNCRCFMCDIWRDTTRQELPLESIRQWLPEWQCLGVKQIALSGGEPLMHTQFAALCQAIAAFDISITVLTTGLLIKHFADSIGQFCKEVIVSLDGPPELYDRIRNIPRAYARLAQGIAILKAQSPHLRLSVRCTVQRQNFRYLRDTVATAYELGVDHISFLAADVQPNTFGRLQDWQDHQLALKQEELAELRQELDALYEIYSEAFVSGFIAETPDKLEQKLYRYFAVLAGVGELAPVNCNAPWVSCVIETDGSVRPCFFQPRYDKLQVTGRLRDVLNKSQARYWRQQLDTHEDAVCRHCVCSLALRDE